MVWFLAGTALLVYVLLHIPAVQRHIGQRTAKLLSEKLGTEVTVGKVDLGMLNRVIIDDVEILDQQGEKMLTATRLSAKVGVGPLLKGKVSVSSAQIFGMHATLYKDSADAPLNIQFALDSLASRDDSEPPLDLQIGSLVIRHGNIKYDRRDVAPTPGKFSPHHLAISNLSGHIMLNSLTDQDIDLKVKKASLREASGLDLKNLSFELKANNHQTLFTDMHATLPGSTLVADTLLATYTMKDGKPDADSLQYRANINELKLTPSDLAFAIPSLQHVKTKATLSTQFNGTTNSVNVRQLQLHCDDMLTLNASGQASDLDTTPEWLVHVNHLEAQTTALQQLLLNTGATFNLPKQVVNMGHLSYSGDLGSNGNEHAIMGDLETDLGDANINMHVKGQQFNGHIRTEGFHLGTMLDQPQLGVIASAIDVEGQLPLTRDMTLLAHGDITRLDYNGRTYNNIYVDGQYDKETFTGTLSINDPNGLLSVEGTCNLSDTPSGSLSASAHHLNPEALGLPMAPKDHVFDFDMKANLFGNSLETLSGTLDIEGLHIQAPGKSIQLASLHIDTDNASAAKHLDVTTDFGHATLSGDYDYRHIVDCVCNIIHHQLPSLLPHTPTAAHSHLTFAANIDRSDWLQQFTDIDLKLNAPLHIDGSLDENNNQLKVNAHTTSLDYDGSNYQNVEMKLWTSNDSLHATAAVIKPLEDDKRIDLALNAAACNDLLTTNLRFQHHGDKQLLRGNLSTTTDFLHKNGSPLTAHVRMNPSQIFVNDTPWDITPSQIQLAKNNIIIDHLTIKNADQHIIVSGALTDKATDTIHVDLNQLDAAFLSDIISTRGVDFGGKISGDAFITSVYDTPKAQAQVKIDQFTFTDGRMGDLDAIVNWNARENRINIDAIAIDGTEGKTKIDGYVSLAENEILLDVAADGSPLHFLEKHIGSVIDNIDARIDGNVRIFGPLKNVNLEGKVVANGDVSVSSLNTHYTMHNDTVLVIPDHIIFVGDTIFDREGHRGILTGSVDHQHLGRFTFDLNVKASNMLCYDFKEFGNNTFCGTVYASGDCHIKGVRGETTIDVNGTTEKNTIFLYNAASPDALSNQDFIVWNDITPEAVDYSDLPSASGSQPIKKKQHENTPTIVDLPSNLRMNLNINATPDACLRLLMDEASGDYISLYGSGALRASYFNKGAFNIYGNYIVDHGLYKLTIQNVLKKDFQFQPRGTIAFGGNPYDATLNLKATYTVNGVPLSDLNIGNNFTTNNIRVNCIMNIGGTPEQPSIDFDLEMPTVSSDAEQMVRSVINSEEELNQQVIYLLAIGRFYNQNEDNRSETGQSQTSLAMQSLLSGTISQQINNLLNNVIKSNNWNFGANISTGDEGFNNAEYEGLLSGRLLNNRLLFNGQFGYRDNPNATTSFIGDFDIQYLLFPNGNLSVKVYNQTNDRYFIKNSLNTQGIGLIMKKDFNGWRELIGWGNRKKKTKTQQK
ncbi:MAG: translocation/assembly module TamB [Prevotella sp.]|nr:translocation/assembly module TamB [Prevotella sp.]